MALPQTISAIALGSQIVGPFKSAANNYYLIARSSTANQILVRKCADPTVSGAWGTNLGTAVTVANTSTTAVGMLCGVQDGDVLHIASIMEDATTAASSRVHYHKFDMSSDTWTLSNEAVDGPYDTGATAANYRSVSIVRRSTSVIVAYNRVVGGSKFSRVGFRERPDGTGVWSATTALDALGTGSTNAYQINAVKDPQSNRVHFIWYEANALRTRTLSAAGALNTAASSTVGTSIATVTPVAPYVAVAYVSAGTTKVVFSKLGTSSTLQAGLRFDSADNPTISTFSVALAAATSANTWRLFVDDVTVWALYVDTTSQDLLTRSSTDHGATWGTAVTVHTGTISTTSGVIASNGGRVYTQGGNYVVPFAVVDNATWRYNQYILRSTGAVDINVTTGSQTTLAVSQSATAAVDLKVDTSQTTLEAATAGTIQAQEARAVTGAQSTEAVTQSTAVALLAKVTTGTQTTSAAQTLAAADVDAKVTGAQTTLAAIQSAAADVDLNVTGAQATLATTQTGTVGLRIAVTGAQTLFAAATTGTIGSAVLSKTWIKHAGTWKVATPYAKHAGAWKPATVHVKQAGTWKRA